VSTGNLHDPTLFVQRLPPQRPEAVARPGADDRRQQTADAVRGALGQIDALIRAAEGLQRRLEVHWDLAAPEVSRPDLADALAASVVVTTATLSISEANRSLAAARLREVAPFTDGGG
jgi:hypothetical protein